MTAPTPRMGFLMVTYRQQPRAFCTRRRVFMVDDLDSGAADLPFVLAMCVYAGAVLNGRVSGPYRESDARAFARACLIPAEIAERGRTAWKVDQLSSWLGVPPDEFRVARRRCESRTRRRRSS